MDVDFILDELEKFEMVSFYEPYDSDVVKNFEETYGLQLPLDYKEFLTYSNGVGLGGAEVVGVSPIKNAWALSQLYEFEHFLADNPMPVNLIPFSPDGLGNHYCFDALTNNEHSCNIVFWQHDYKYTPEDKPEITNTSFFEWIKDVMIDFYSE